MAARAHPPGKSKTDLRRGHFTPKAGVAVKAAAHRPVATTHDEQAFLFNEPAAVEKVPARESLTITRQQAG